MRRRPASTSTSRATLPIPAASQRHCQLVRNVDGRWELIDVGSTNGTTINESTTPLAEGFGRGGLRRRPHPRRRLDDDRHPLGDLRSALRIGGQPGALVPGTDAPGDRTTANWYSQPSSVFGSWISNVSTSPWRASISRHGRGWRGRRTGAAAGRRTVRSPRSRRRPTCRSPAVRQGDDADHLGDRLVEALVGHVHERAHRPQRVERSGAERQVVQRPGDGVQILLTHQPDVLMGEVDADHVDAVRTPCGGVAARPCADVDHVAPALGAHEFRERVAQSLAVLADPRPAPARALLPRNRRSGRRRDPPRQCTTAGLNARPPWYPGDQPLLTSTA